jgi:Sec-independent protein translocase protein TatA
MFLDPMKLLVIAVVAIMVLGPEHLPTLARKVSTVRAQLAAVNQRLETEARALVPDLPDLGPLSAALRSPSALLDHLTATDSADAEVDEHSSASSAQATTIAAATETPGDPFDGWPRSALSDATGPDDETARDAVITASLN